MLTDSTAIPLAPVRAAKRDPVQEAKARYILGSLLFNAQLWAMLTKSTDDDRIIAYLSKAVQDETRWAELADAIWGPLPQ